METVGPSGDADTRRTDRRPPGPRRLYSLRDEVRLARRELTARRQPGGIRLDPRRWTARGWADAAYGTLATLLVVFSPGEADGSWSVFHLGLGLLIAMRAATAWWLVRRSGTDAQERR